MREEASKQRDFFNSLAADWRKDHPVEKAVFDELFGQEELVGKSVLDVGCGTGVLSRYLSERGATVDGIDLSDEMIRRAKNETTRPGVRFFCADFYDFNGKYDCLFVFDAYPHFFDKRLFAVKARDLLVPGGRLYIAFDESREKIDGHHEKAAKGVSVGLRSPEEEALAYVGLLSVAFTRDDDKYLLTLTREPSNSATTL
ncbi:MAG: class I SAM-dependent methyltransferase [Clostridia bacterium]|nr:class I SAM-dependent methyltransferase [Clostridia bacterium]